MASVGQNSTAAFDAQEQVCRVYAQDQGYKLIKIFMDSGSGNSLDRPGLQAMLEYLVGPDGTGATVIIPDMAVAARDMQCWIQLRARLDDLGSAIESPNQSYGNSTDDRFVEKILAAREQFAEELQ